MASIVEQLQQAALDRNVSVSDLLRRVKFVAAKLGLGSVEDWVEQELNGYDGQPADYREVHGTPMGFNPVRGWMAIGGSVEPLSSRRNGQPVSALEALIESAKGASLQIPYSDRVREILDQQNGVRGWNYALQIPSSELTRILDRVRTLILDWALNLEKAGIMGSEHSFDSSEKQKAQAASTTINIGTIGSFTGNLGQGNIATDVTSSVAVESVSPLIKQLRAHFDEVVAAGANATTLEARLSSVEAAIAHGKVQKGLRGLLTDLRSTLTGAAGNLVASGAIAALNVLLGTGVPSG